MIVDIEQTEGRLAISYVGEDGDIKMLRLTIPPAEMFNWVLSKPNQKADPVYTSWDGKPVRKQRSNFLTRYRIEEFLHALPKHIKEELYATHQPKLFFCDIETEVTDDGFPDVTIAKNAVTAIAFCTGKTVIALGTKKLDAKQIKRINEKINEHFKDFYDVKFNYIYFESEYDMLYSFFGKAIHKMPLITGWHFMGFDWPYLINRAKRLGIDPGIASTSGKLITKQELPQHRMVVDYLEIYKNWDMTVDVKENNSLDFVSNAVLGLQKIKYNGTLQELYDNDFEEYIFYNAVDALLVQLIHEKIQTMQTYLSLGNITGVEARMAFSPIWMAESVMIREFLKRDKVFPRTHEDERRREAYEGGFVFDPVPGLYEWVVAFDFASLYPSIMRQWNISPESYIHNTDENVDTKKHIKTVSGAVFDKKEDSVFRTILTEYYGMRVDAKTEMIQAEQELEYLTGFL